MNRERVVDYTVIKDERIRSKVCELMSEMLDNPDEHGIYPTSRFMSKMEDFIIEEKSADRIIAEEGNRANLCSVCGNLSCSACGKGFAEECSGWQPQQPKLPEKLRLDIREDTQHQICGIEYFLSQLLDYLKAREERQ